jgi:polyphosphate kinase 2 (PPK2 family)
VFEAAELGQRIDEETFAREIPRLRVELVNAQYDLRNTDHPVILLFDGDDRVACSTALHGMYDWADGRYVEANALGPPTREERERPLFWRYWQRLPRRGRIGVFLGGWADEAIRDRFARDIDSTALDRRIEHIRRFEQALVDDGALVLKLWFHLPREEYRKRLKRARREPGFAWRIPAEEKRIYRNYDRVMSVAEHVVRETSTGDAPAPGGAAHGPVAPAPGDEPRSVLDGLDLSRSIPWQHYRERLERWQAELNRLSRRARKRGVASVLVFEGWDAAGKGGVIRRLSAALDPRDLHVVPIAAPTEEEKAHHYLWRFWPHIDADEQLRRFQARLRTPYKKYEITDEDGRNRARRDDYVRAVNEMVARTSTESAPWRLVAGNDKRSARLEVIETFCEALERRL